MKRRIWILLLLAVVIFASIAMMFGSRKGTVTIVNQSDEMVLSGTLEVCKQKFTVQPLKPSDTQVIYYKVKSDSHYGIVVNLKSGTLRKQLGYVTNGRDFDDTLVVNNDGISLASNKSNK